MKHRYAVFLFWALIMVALPIMAGAEEGSASYYADSLSGNPTASGEPYDKNALTAAHRTLPFDTMVKVTNLTAAHRTLPFDTMVKVTNLNNDKTVVVRINDRGPHSKKRIIDVSGVAAKQLDLIDSGTARVRVEVQD